MLFLFGISILYDVVLILTNSVLTAPVLTALGGGSGAALATGSFLSLFYVYYEVLELFTPERLATEIEESISSQQFQQYLESLEKNDRTASNPFQNPVSAAAVTIRKSEQRGAVQLTTSIADSFNSIFEDTLTDTKDISDEQQSGLLSTIRKIRDLGDEAVANDLFPVLAVVLDRLRKAAITALNHPLDEVAGRTITMFATLGRKGYKNEMLSEATWKPFEQLITTAVERESEEGLIASVEGLNQLMSKLLDNADLVPTKETHIAQQLIEDLFDGWSDCIEDYGGKLDHSQFYDMISYLDFYMNSEELDEEEHYLVLYLVFENVVGNLVDEYIYDSVNSGGFSPVVSIALIDGIKSAAQTAVEIRHEYLAKRICKILIELVVGIDHDGPFNTHALRALRELAQSDDCGKHAVTDALSELQEPTTATQGIPRILQLSTTGYESEGDFIDRVEALEDELADVLSD